MAEMANEVDPVINALAGTVAIPQSMLDTYGKGLGIAPLSVNKGLEAIHSGKITRIAKAESLGVAKNVMLSDSSKAAQAMNKVLKSPIYRGLSTAGGSLSVAAIGFDTVGGYYSDDLGSSPTTYDRVGEASIQLVGATTETMGALGMAHLGGLTGAALTAPTGPGALLGYGAGAVIGTGAYYFSGLNDMVEHGWEDITRGLRDWVNDD